MSTLKPKEFFKHNQRKKRGGSVGAVKSRGEFSSASKEKNSERLVKSRQRVRDLAEVYTPIDVVDAMLDLPGISASTSDLWSTVLEPACGNGNFLVAILNRKLEAFLRARPRCTQDTLEFSIVAAVSTVYGIDISRENVKEARARLTDAVREFYLVHRGGLKPSEGFYEAIDSIVCGTVVWGDSINGASTTELTEFIPERSGRTYTKRFRTRKHTLQELLTSASANKMGQLNLMEMSESHRFPLTRPVHFLHLGTTALVGE
jgi:SAM-dependent methyltransferase